MGSRDAARAGPNEERKGDQCFAARQCLDHYFY